MFLDLTLGTVLVVSLLLGLRRGALRFMLGLCGWIALLLVAPHVVPFAVSGIARVFPTLGDTALALSAWATTLFATWLILVRGAVAGGEELRRGSLLLRLADSAAGFWLGAVVGVFLTFLSLLLVLWWAGSISPDGWLAEQRDASLLVEVLRTGLRTR